MKTIDLKIHQPEPPPYLLERLTRHCGRYTDMISIFHLIESDREHFVGVAGDGDNGSYEWFISTPDKFEASDQGWGNTMDALCEVLNRVCRGDEVEVGK